MKGLRSSPPFLIAALGNPGPEYRRHRHNVGFLVGEELHRRWGWGPARTKFQGLYGEGRIGEARVVLLLPLTFMNRSGQAVAEAVRFHRVPPEKILVVHDEVELPFGVARLKEGGGLGGHNGLRSLVRHLATGAFWRLRVGVGRPDSPRESLADYVLSEFSEPANDVDLLVGQSADLAELWLKAGGSYPEAGVP